MQNPTTVYLDYAATAPLRPEALAAYEMWSQEPCSVANPNSLHSLGRAAASHLEAARSSLAGDLGGGFRPHELIFTSGGTEADNLAIFGLVNGALRSGKHDRTKIILSSLEHDAIYRTIASLKRAGFEVLLVPARRDGFIHPEDLEPLLDEKTLLVSIMYANNELGTIQPIDELASLTHKAGALFHTDAVQAFGKIPLHLDHVDAVSVTAHKLGGPVGIGALAIRQRLRLEPLLVGGGQERNLRSGTQNVAFALAFARVSRLLADNMANFRAQTKQHAKYLYQTLCGAENNEETSSRKQHPIQATVGTELSERRLAGIVHLTVNGIDSDTLILSLDALGFAVSAASACSAHSSETSHVLAACGVPSKEAEHALRVSFDERVSHKEIADFAEALLGLVYKAQ